MHRLIRLLKEKLDAIGLVKKGDLGQIYDNIKVLEDKFNRVIIDLKKGLRAV